MARTLLLGSGLFIGTVSALALMASAQTQTYDNSGFSELEARQSIKVIYTASQTYSVTADIENDKPEELLISTQGDTLVLERPKRSGRWFRNNSRPKITVYVSAPTLSSVQISSSASFKGDRLTGPAVSLYASSSGDIELDSVTTETLRTRASSSASIELAGTCTSLEARASSSASISGDGLVCSNADIEASSSSGVELAVDGGAVDLNMSSSGGTELSGTCDRIEISASSGAEVDGRDLTCNRVDIRASSGADIEIGSRGSVEASASSGADIDIYGSPTDIDKRITSGGDVDVHRAL